MGGGAAACGPATAAGGGEAPAPGLPVGGLACQAGPGLVARRAVVGAKVGAVAAALVEAHGVVVAVVHADLHVVDAAALQLGVDGVQQGGAHAVGALAVGHAQVRQVGVLVAGVPHRVGALDDHEGVADQRRLAGAPRGDDERLVGQRLEHALALQGPRLLEGPHRHDAAGQRGDVVEQRPPERRHQVDVLGVEKSMVMASGIGGPPLFGGDLGLDAASLSQSMSSTSTSTTVVSRRPSA